MPDRIQRRAAQSGAAHVAVDASENLITCSGRWTSGCLGDMELRLTKLPLTTGSVVVDLESVTALDMTGAWLVHRTRERLEADGRAVQVVGATDVAKRLLELVENNRPGQVPASTDSHGLVEDIGRSSTRQVAFYVEFLEFVGNVTYLAMRAALRPATMYWAVIVKELEEAGFDALPIVGLLTTLIGVVIAYQGGIVLAQYGGSIFIADMVGAAILRELSPLITAIIVAGRTGSAYTAQIGTMQVTEEVDALRSMGISPIDLLVLPKVIALVVALPLLTMFGDIMGLLGGAIMANALLDISLNSFVDRLSQVINIETFLIGIGKAPVFAAIIAGVGTFQGFRVSGGADSVGKQTTLCVVQCIFLVIVVDAIFSIIFSRLGI
ncbi:MAG: MlaE family lipid ABC transporter permease subunit [Pseudomonadota bacterium]